MTKLILPVCLVCAWVAPSGAQSTPIGGVVGPIQPSAEIRPFRAVQLGPSTFFQVQRAFGTLAFNGIVERVDLGQDYEFRAVVAATFLADAAVNRVSFVALRDVRLVATVSRGPNERATVLYEERQPIVVDLTNDRETQWLPPLVFRLSKSVASNAHHVGFAVSDGRLLWPIATEMK